MFLNKLSTIDFFLIFIPVESIQNFHPSFHLNLTFGQKCSCHTSFNSLSPKRGPKLWVK